MDDMFNPFFNHDDDMPIEEVIKDYMEREGMTIGKSEEEINELIQAVINPNVSMNEMASLLGIDMDLDFDQIEGMPSPEDILMNMIDDLELDPEELDIPGILEGFMSEDEEGFPMPIKDEFLENFEFSENPDMLTMMDEMEEFINHYSEDWIEGNESPWLKLNSETFLESKYELAQIYFENGLFSEALRHFKEINEHVPDYRQHTRHYIMAIYTIFNDIEHGSKFFSSNQDHANDDMMLLMYLVLAIVKRQDKLSVMLFERLANQNQDTNRLATETVALNLPNLLEKYVEDDFETNQEKRRGIDYLLKAYSYLVPYIFQIENYLFESFKRFVGESSVLPDERIGMYGEVSVSVTRALNREGIYTYGDLENYTEKEIASIKGIGKTAMRDLKEAGAQFKL